MHGVVFAEVLAALHGVVLAQRVAVKLVVIEQALEVGVAFELDAVLVPGFTLLPVGDGEEVVHRGHRGLQTHRP